MTEKAANERRRWTFEQSEDGHRLTRLSGRLLDSDGRFISLLGSRDCALVAEAPAMAELLEVVDREAFVCEPNFREEVRALLTRIKQGTGD